MTEKNDSDLKSNSPEEAGKPTFLATATGKWTLGIIGAVVVAVAIVLALFLTGIIGSNPAVAAVNGERIYQKELDQRIKNFQAQQGTTGQKLDPQMEQQLKAFFLNDLIQQQLALQEARRMKIKVSNKEVETRIKEIENRLTPKGMNQLLKQMDWTREDLKEEIKRGLMVQKAAQKATGNIKVSEEEIEKYYQENKKTFQEPEKVKIKIVDFTSQDKAKKMVAAVKKGENFDKAAKKYTQKTDIKSEELSQEKINSGFGTDVGKAAFQLKPGQNSDAIKTDKGIFVVKVEEKKKAVQKSFKDVKENIRAILFGQKQQQKYGQWVESLKKKATIKIFDKELEGAIKIPSGHP